MKIHMGRIAALALILCGALAASGCASAGGRGFLFRDADYGRLGLDRTAVQPWEDGMRTTGGKGTYEWWYFDAALDDGSTLVIVFYTKSMVDVGTELRPMITIKQTGADGKAIFSRTIKAVPGDFSSSKEGCDARIGNNRFWGGGGAYSIHIDEEGLSVDLALAGTVPAFRPATGHAFFADASGAERYFAWLPSVPRGVVSGSMTVGGAAHTLRGTGYHDHNWGDASLLGLIHHWYWGRANVGDYTVVASAMTATKAYSADQSTVFFLSRGAAQIPVDPASVRVSFSDMYVDAETGKPVANKIVYDCDAGSESYRVSFIRHQDIEVVKLADLGGWKSRLAAWFITFDGAYLRFTGGVVIERFVDGALTETERESTAVWELMYLGHAENLPPPAP